MSNINMNGLVAPNSFDFPFTPYDIQHEFMKNLYTTLESAGLGIFESPTGTGKSLSIICGALRWLKDHYDNERTSLVKRIDDLKLRKEQIASKSWDWLSSQSEEIELTRQINFLNFEYNKIVEYDKKIAQIQKPKKREKIEIAVEIKEKVQEDDDFLPEEPHSDIDSSDEEIENKYEPTKIYICSRTHSQLEQFIGEIKKSPFSRNVRVVSLASRQIYCINPTVNSLKNVSLINDKCLDMQKNKNKADKDGKITKRQKTTCKCPFFKQQSMETLKNHALTEITDIEDLVKLGKETRACPYYASRYAVEDAEIILVPYNTILHKATREANGIKLKNNIVIIDEAHNVLEAMTQMYKSELNYRQIKISLQQLKCYKQRFHTRFSANTLLHINQLIFVVGKLQQFFDKNAENIFTIENFVLTAQIDNYNMFKLVKFCKESRLSQKIRNYSIKFQNDEIAKKPVKSNVKEFLNSIENKQLNKPILKEEQVQENLDFSSSNFLSIVGFLESLTYSYDDGRILVTKNTENSPGKLQFLLLNPSVNFRDIVREARSVIVAGGTMKPTTEFKERLFMNSGANPTRIVEFSCDHIIPVENILPIILTKGNKHENLLFNYENRMTMGTSLIAIMQETCKTIKGGIVVFFPSYNYENWIWNQIKNITFNRQIFREPQDSSSVDSVLRKYSDVIKKSSQGALLLSVIGGKLSEGLNFSDDLGRCIIVVGLPYANIKALDLKEKMSYLDKKEGFGSGQQFYETLCMKSVNQSIGRAVRHKNDYATILLVDERYNRISTKNALPNWIKKSLRICEFQEAFVSIREFFQKKSL